ncbi:hypothetical protein [Aquimarina rhabdastrellae]
MKKFKLIMVISVLLMVSQQYSYGQQLAVVKASSISVDELPEYVIITSQNTKLLGGINIIIDYKKSLYKQQLRELEELLQDGDKLRVRNQTDLLNAMAVLGFEYVNAYNASTVTPSIGKDDVDVLFDELDGGEGSFRVNMVFRKKEKYRK